MQAPTKSDATGIAGVVVGAFGSVAILMIPWDVPLWLKHTGFWVALVVFVFGVQWLVHLHLLEGQSQRRKFAIHIGVTITCLFLISYIEIPRILNSQASGNYIKLIDLFSSDFANLSKASDERELIFTNPSDGTKSNFTVKFEIVRDFRINSYVIAVYIPNFSDARPSNNIKEIIQYMRDGIKKHGEELFRSVSVSMAIPGELHGNNEITFSGTVYIYTGNELSIVDLGDLTKWYLSAGMHLVVRGLDYLAFTRLRHS